MLRGKLLTLLTLMCITTASFGQFSVTLDGTDPTCNGFSNGAITTNTNGGTAPFIYSYSNGFSGQTISGLSAGTYSVTVSDANNETATGSVTLNNPSMIEGGLSLDDVCAGNGNVSSNATGGAGGYSYAWDDGQTTANATGLAPGTRCVTITDANGCSAVSCITVFEELSVDVLATTTLLCFDACDASITANVSGGSGPFTFAWNTGATTPILESVPLGTYSVTVTDSNGCETSGTTTVGAPSPIDVTVSVTNPACGSGGTGSATASANGGTPPYQYMFSGGQVGPTVDNLAPGNYNVVVTDANGCQTIQSFSIVQDGNIDLAVSTTDATACGSADGTASATPSGGTAPYTYAWSTGSINSSISGLAPGSYSVTVTDADGCAAVGTANIGGSPDITLTSMGIDPDCGSQDGGTAIVMAFDGTPPFTFLWSNGATMGVTSDLDPGTYTVTVTDAAGCTATTSVVINAGGNLDVSISSTNPLCNGSSDGSLTATANNGTAPYSYLWSNGATTATVSNAPAGDYTVTVTDATGCTGVANSTLTQPNQLNLTLASTDAGCGGDTNGTATSTVDGGTSPYTYIWSNGATTANLTGLAAGTYTLTVTDNNGCTAESSVTISESESPTVTASVTNPNTTGNNGEATAVASGGTAPYTYLWSDGQTTATATGLSPGIYTVTVTDANGCTAVASIEILDNCDNFTDPGEICCDQTLCAPGNTPAPLTSLAPATGGSGTIEYIWMMSTNGGPFDPNTWTLIPGATGLTYAPGPLNETTFFARCARRLPCTTYLETETVTITVETGFAAVIDGSTLNCVGDVVTFTSTDFGPDVTYSWDFGSLANPSTATTPTVDVTWDFVTSPTITLSITNASGCTSTATLSIAVTDSPILCGPGAINMIANVNDNGTVALNWEAAQSGSNTTLTVQRSADGVNFEALEMMEMTNNAYSYVDAAPMRGQNAYRVMVEDDLGNVMYSEVATVTIANSNELFFLYPNPFTNELTISVAEEVESNVQVNIFTAQGQLTKSMEMEEGNYGQQLNMEDMPAGIYYVRFQLGTEGSRIVRVIKE